MTAVDDASRARRAELLLKLNERRRAASDHPRVKAVRYGRRLTLGAAQLRFWFLQQLAPESGVYNVPLRVRLRGRLDVDALEHALSELVARHEILRTRCMHARRFHSFPLHSRRHASECQDPPKPSSILCWNFGARRAVWLLSPMTTKAPKELLGSDPDCLCDVDRLSKVETALESLVLADEALWLRETFSECRLTQADLRPCLDQRVHDEAVIVVVAC